MLIYDQHWISLEPHTKQYQNNYGHVVLKNIYNYQTDLKYKVVSPISHLAGDRRRWQYKAETDL